jgi:hypothetical protein
VPQAGGDAIDEGLNADEARIRMRRGLRHKVLAPTEADFEDERMRLVFNLPPCGGGGREAAGGGACRRVVVCERWRAGAPPTPCPRPARGRGFAKQRAHINLPLRRHGQVRQQRVQQPGLPRLQRPRLDAPVAAQVSGVGCQGSVPSATRTRGGFLYLILQSDT